MKRAVSILVTLIVLVLVFAGLQLHRNLEPQQVFNRMLENNLATTGVTRQINGTGSGLSVDQYVQLNLGSHPTAHALTILREKDARIETEEISDMSQDFVRFKTIKRQTGDGKPLNTKGVVGEWAELSANSALSGIATTGLFEQSINGLIPADMPIANLSAAERPDMLAFIKLNNVYNFNVSKVKTVQEQGRSAYQYTVSIQPAAYVAMMQHLGNIIGTTAYKHLDPNNYVGSASVQATITIDKLSGQLLKVTQPATGYTESYSGYGIRTDTELPKATLTATELEKRITGLQQ